MAFSKHIHITKYAPRCNTFCNNIFTYVFRYECAINKHLIESGLNVYAYLTLRVIANLGPGYFLNASMQEQLSERSRSEKKGVEGGDSAGDIYRSEDFLNLYALMAHEEDLDTEEWILRTLVAVFLLKSLQLTNFFKNNKGKDQRTNGVAAEVEGNSETLTEDELLVCKIILRMINICPTNCHDVSEFETPVADSFTTACNKVSLGAAIYPTLALFNHACDPSFMRCNKGNAVVCVANRKIRKGRNSVQTTFEDP